MCKKEKYYSHYFKERKKEFKCPASNDGSPACLKHDCTIKFNGIEYPIANCLIYDGSMICDLCEKQHHIISTFRSSEQGIKEAEIYKKYLKQEQMISEEKEKELEEKNAIFKELLKKMQKGEISTQEFFEKSDELYKDLIPDIKQRVDNFKERWGLK